jgi:hypothetical protein
MAAAPVAAPASASTAAAQIPTIQRIMNVLRRVIDSLARRFQKLKLGVAVPPSAE